MEIPLQERNYRTGMMYRLFKKLISLIFFLENRRNDNLTDDILYNNTNNVDNIPKRKRYNFIPVFGMHIRFIETFMLYNFNIYFR